MIKLDLSKAFPPRVLVYFIAVIPGLLFESTLIVANPERVHSLLANVERAVAIPPYAVLISLLASALVIGHVFTLLAWFGDLLLEIIYRTWLRFIRITFGSRTFYQLLGRLQGTPPKRNILVRLFSWAVFKARMPTEHQNLRAILKCLGTASQQLLKKRYGIDAIAEMPSSEEWHVWYSVLGKPIPGFIESVTVMRASLACGIAGFVAMAIEPSLRTRSFRGFCVVLAAYGLYRTWTVFRWRTDPARLNIMRLQCVLLDLADAQTTPAPLDAAEEK